MDEDEDEDGNGEVNSQVVFQGVRKVYDVDDGDGEDEEDEDKGRGFRVGIGAETAIAGKEEKGEVSLESPS